MPKNIRFYFAKAELQEVGNQLLQRSYTQLADCTRDNTPGKDKMIIDTENETFWLLDNPCFENSAITISNTLNTELVELGENTIKTI